MAIGLAAAALTATLVPVALAEGHGDDPLQAGARGDALVP